jgi:hypothetical protein
VRPPEGRREEVLRRAGAGMRASVPAPRVPAPGSRARQGSRVGVAYLIFFIHLRRSTMDLLLLLDMQN